MKLIKTACVAFCLLLPALTVRAHAADSLVSAAWLKAHLSDAGVVVLHVGPKAQYEQAHIPGSRHVVPQDLSIPRTEGALILQMLPEAELRSKLEQFGISDASRVIIAFGDGGLSLATRVFFALDVAGLGDNAALLDGGLGAWTAAGGATTAEVPTWTPGKITKAGRRPLVATLDDVRSAGASKVRVIDARAPEFYLGESPGAMPRAGHIPGAQNLPYSSFVDGAGLMKNSAEIAEMFKTAGVGPGDRLVSYCHIGQQASVVYFAAKRLGFDARLYDGSWDEWSRREDLPVEKPPVK